ncbi:hypothetical protein WJX81_003201 [Elliptochloris bilobata]|uniref:Uncharacterized protein n=1 Tax=Elliptochloris bilobata TaxID=381761 RepID=A0AAW1SKL6_9CHLO
MVMCSSTGAALRTIDCRFEQSIVRVGQTSLLHLAPAAACDYSAPSAASDAVVLGIRERIKVRELRLRASNPPNRMR